MTEWTNGMLVAIVHAESGKVLATAKVDKVTNREIRTETPYVQLEDRNRDLMRRYWRAESPHTEMRIPRDEKATRARCIIRVATVTDIDAASRRLDVRQARAQMPQLQRDKAEHEQNLERLETQLRRAREPYEWVLNEIAKAEALIKGDDAEVPPC